MMWLADQGVSGAVPPDPPMFSPTIFAELVPAERTSCVRVRAACVLGSDVCSETRRKFLGRSARDRRVGKTGLTLSLKQTAPERNLLLLGAARRKEILGTGPCVSPEPPRLEWQVGAVGRRVLSDGHDH